MQELQKLYRFFKDIEPLKDTLRTGITQQGRTESVAEHSWRLATMAIVFVPHYFPELDLKKVMMMCLIHDLGEIINGDIPAPLQASIPNKNVQEKEDFQQIIKVLPTPLADELLTHWEEYESASTGEARFVKALDKIETIMQHNQGNHDPNFDHTFDLSYGKKYTDADPIMQQLRAMVDTETQALVHKK